MDEHAQAISRVCEEAVTRLARDLPEREVSFLSRRDDVLTHLAHQGRLRLIYEVPRELGGITWRAATTGAVQVVPEVAADGDYVASDDAVRSEIAAPVRAGGQVVGVLDVEFTGELVDGDAELVSSAAQQLGDKLEPFYVS